MHKNKIAVGVIIVCLLALSVTGFFIYQSNVSATSNDQITLTFKKTNTAYAVNSQLNAPDFVGAVGDGVVDIQYPKMDTSKVGERPYIYSASDAHGNKKDFVLVLKFVSSTLPTLKLKQPNLEVIEGTDIDFKSYIKEANDEIDGKLEVSIEVPENVKAVGTHDITYSATNKSGYEVHAVLRLVVKEKTKNEEKPTPVVETPQTGTNEPTEPIYLPSPAVDSPVIVLPPAKPENKSFLFTDGYNMQTAPSACSAYLNSNQGSAGYCTNVTNADGTLAGQQAIFH